MMLRVWLLFCCIVAVVVAARHPAFVWSTGQFPELSGDVNVADIVSTAFSTEGIKLFFVGNSLTEEQVSAAYLCGYLDTFKETFRAAAFSEEISDVARSTSSLLELVEQRAIDNGNSVIVVPMIERTPDERTVMLSDLAERVTASSVVLVLLPTAADLTEECPEDLSIIAQDIMSVLAALEGRQYIAILAPEQVPVTAVPVVAPAEEAVAEEAPAEAVVIEQGITPAAEPVKIVPRKARYTSAKTTNTTDSNTIWSTGFVAGGMVTIVLLIVLAFGLSFLFTMQAQAQASAIDLPKPKLQ